MVIDRGSIISNLPACTSGIDRWKVQRPLLQAGYLTHIDLLLC